MITFMHPEYKILGIDKICFYINFKHKFSLPHLPRRRNQKDENRHRKKKKIKKRFTQKG